MTNVVLDEDRPDAGAALRPVPWLREGVGVSAVTFVLLAVQTALAVGSLVGAQESFALVAVQLLGAVVPCVLLVPAAWWSRARPARHRVGWYAVAAVASALAVRTVQTIGALIAGQAGPGWHLGGMAASTVVGLLPAVVTVWAAAALVVGVVERWRAGVPWSRHATARGAEVVGLGLGLTLVGVLALQWLSIYFTLFGDQPQPTPADGVRYVVTASTCLVLVVTGIVAAWLAEHRGILRLGVVILVVAIVAVATLAVPADRWTGRSVPPERPVPAFEPCYSGGTDECEGGG